MKQNPGNELFKMVVASLLVLLIQLSWVESSKTYTCQKKHCNNGHCVNVNYKGTNPPKWCQNLKGKGFHKSHESSWSSQCGSNGGCTVSNKFSQTYQQLGQSTQPMTFAVECSNNMCDIKTCKGSQCRNGGRISQPDLEKEVSHLPRCGSSRRKRSWISRLKGYCCDIRVSSNGSKSFSIIPIGSIG